MSLPNSHQSGRRPSASVSPATSPTVPLSTHLAPSLPPSATSLGYNASAGPSSTSLNRQGSSSSQRSSRPSLRGMVPSPRIAPSMPPPSSHPGSGSSSAEASKPGSGSSTPRLLSRRSSTKEGSRPAGLLLRKVSDRARGKARVEDGGFGGNEGWRSPVIEGESESVMVVETPHATSRKDPETGNRMINQYIVHEEIGRGAHGTVRLGQETYSDGVSQIPGAWCAIKITDRVQKRAKLQTLRKGTGRADGGKMMGESEIRKEVAIFKKVAHPNIVRLKEIIDDPDQSKIFMVLELCERGEIRWKTESGGPALTITETRGIFRDTLSGLAYHNVVKISDFGCSHYSEALAAASAQTGPDSDRYVDDVELAKTAGSPAFFAPEMCYSGLDDDVTSTRDNLSPFGTPAGDVPGFTIRPPSVASEFGEVRPSRADPLITSPGGGRIIPLNKVQSNDSGGFRRPMSARSQSSNTVQLRKEQRLPITNAIDVWALGVTLYCLLFGRTPFDAPNEYLLMQVIPTQDYEIPATMGRDRQPTSGPNATVEALEGVEMLRKLLEKTPGKRMTLEQAKRHPFTLRDLDDPTHWLASADPHTRDFVTVSNDEVVGVTTRLTFSQKVKRGIKSFGHKLQSLGSGRSRTQSVGGYDDYPSATGSSDQSYAPSRAGSIVNMTAEGLAGVNSPAPSLRRSRMTSTNRDHSPMTSPAATGSVSRRLSIFGRLGGEPSPGPRAHTVQLGSPTAGAQPDATAGPAPAFEGLDRTPTGIPSPYTAGSKSGFIVDGSKVHAPSHLLPPPASTRTTTLTADVPRSPTKMSSTSSLDKFGRVSTVSPPPPMHRRMSDIEISAGRQRAPSNASSAQASMSGFGKLVKLLSRTSSSRSGSRFSRRSRAEQSAGSDVDDHAVSASASPVEALRRISLDEENLSRRSQDREPYHSDLDGVTSSSYSSRMGAMHSPGQSFDSHGHGSTMQWSSRLPGMDLLPARRSSSPNAAVLPLAHSDLDGEAEELDIQDEVDWKVSDDEEFDDTPSLSSPAYRGISPFGGSGFGSPFRDVREREADARDQLGLIAQSLQDNIGPSATRTTGPPILPPLKTHHILEDIPDASPPDAGFANISSAPATGPDPHAHIFHPQPISPTSTRTQTARISTSPTNAMGMMDLGHGHQHAHGFGAGGGSYRSSSRTSSKASGSPYRAAFGNRARSPLGRLSDEDDMPESLRDSPSGHPYHPPSPVRSGPARVETPASADLAGTSASSSHAGSPHRVSLARQSSSGSGFTSIKSPITPGSGSASCAAGIAVSSSGLGLIDMPRAVHGREEGGVEEEEEGLAIVLGSKRGRKGSVLGRRSVLED